MVCVKERKIIDVVLMTTLVLLLTSIQQATARAIPQRPWTKTTSLIKMTTTTTMMSTDSPNNSSWTLKMSNRSPEKSNNQRGHAKRTEVARSYNSYGGSGGYSSYNSGSMMYSNFDTALTTLAFLSFGVFLLNMLFSFLDFGTPIGPIVRNDGKDGKSKRSTSPTLSPAALLALNAIQKTLSDNESFAVNRKPVCALRVFCGTKGIHSFNKLDDTLFNTLTNLVLNDTTATIKKRLKMNDKFKRMVRSKLGIGTCAELIRSCPLPKQQQHQIRNQTAGNS